MSNEVRYNKMKEIEPTLNRHVLLHKLSRLEEMVLARLQIGHTRITYSWLLNRGEQPYWPGAIARSVAMSLGNQEALRLFLASGTFFVKIWS